MSAPDPHALRRSVEDFLYRKCELCDRQEWDSYLDLYDEQAEFHIPQWDGDHVYTRDPRREMSLIYYPSRAGLEDRVFRLRTGKSAASTPLPRTMHDIANVRVQARDDGGCLASVNWTTHYCRLGESSVFYGWADYALRPAGGGWKITRQHTVLINDVINAVLDFYHV